MVQIIVEDVSGHYVQTITGVYKNGLFEWHKGLFGKAEQLSCNYNWKFPTRKGFEFRYMYDGKNFNQIQPSSAKDLPSFGSTKLSDKEILHLAKTSEYEKDMMMAKPLDLKQILEFLLIIFIIIGSIGNYYAVQNLGKQIATALQPFSSFANDTHNMVLVQQNQTLQLYRLYNKTYQTQGQILLYLRQQQPLAP